MKTELIDQGELFTELLHVQSIGRFTHADPSAHGHETGIVSIIYLVQKVRTGGLSRP